MAMQITFTIQHQSITTMECSNLQHQIVIDIFQMTSGAHLQILVLLQIGIYSSRDIQRITLNSWERIFTHKQGKQQTSSILNSQRPIAWRKWRALALYLLQALLHQLTHLGVFIVSFNQDMWLFQCLERACMLLVRIAQSQRPTQWESLLGD